MSSFRWVILAVSTLGFMQVHIHRVSFAPLIPTFIADLGLTYAAAGAIMTGQDRLARQARVGLPHLLDGFAATGSPAR